MAVEESRGSEKLATATSEREHVHFSDKQHLGARSNGTYVSPSDAILSPASQKLAGFKQRQITKQNDKARRTLFARTASASTDDSTASSEEIKW